MARHKKQRPQRERKVTDLNYGTPISSSPRSFHQVGTSLSWNMLGSFNGYLRNPNWGYMQEYERAMLTDETVSVGVWFIVYSLLAAMGEYEHSNPQHTKFIRDMFTHMQGTEHQMVGDLLTSALWAGHGVSEAILESDGRHVYLNSVENYHPAYIYYVVDDHGKLNFGHKAGLQSALKTGVYQRHPFRGTPVALPKNRTCVITHRGRHNNYYGESIIQPIYKNWLFKDAVFGMWAVALDRYGTPIPVAIVPRVTTGVPVDDPYAPGGKRSQTYAEAALGTLQSLSAGGSLVFEEYSKDHPVKVDSLTSGNNFGTSFLDAVKYCNQAMFRGMLIPRLLLEEGKSGSSKGLATIHYNVFHMVLESLYQQLIHPIVQQIIGPILYWNFGERDPGRFPMVPYDASMIEVIANNFDKLINGGVIDMRMIEDFNMMRKVFRFSPVSQLMFDKMQYLAIQQEAKQIEATTSAQLRAEKRHAETPEEEAHRIEVTETARAKVQKKYAVKPTAAPGKTQESPEEEARRVRLVETARAQVRKKYEPNPKMETAEEEAHRTKLVEREKNKAKHFAPKPPKPAPAKPAAKGGGAKPAPKKPAKKATQLSAGGTEEAVVKLIEAGGLPHVVVVVPVDENGRILLVRRSAGESNRAREWEVPGGHRDAYENITQCAFREMLEETSLACFPMADVNVTFPLRSEHGEDAYGVMIGARVLPGSKVRLDRHEHDRYMWVWPEDLENFFPVPPNFYAQVREIWGKTMVVINEQEGWDRPDYNEDPLDDEVDTPEDDDES